MVRGSALVLLVTFVAASAFLFQAGQTPSIPLGYADQDTCATCHQGIWESYRQTGMGRSFYRPARENTIEDYSRNNTFYHRASDQHYTMYRREGRYYQRRHQIGPDGRETNVVEKQIDYVLGSGNHSRTYLQRTPRGQLIELPLAWYSEKGGFWAMNPGYDSPDHMDFRRKIGKECFYCHNAYAGSESGAGDPELVLNGAIPEGIDCQRCHGPGAAHVRSAQGKNAAAVIRSAIVNPARLSAERQLELCFQCHLKSSNRRLPYSVRRFGHGYFYRPGEPLENYVLHFDNAPGTGFDDKFEITHSAYRLLKSACFLKSNGALGCTTCHNPHQIQRGSEGAQHYVRVCRKCHAAGLDRLTAAGTHVQSQDCLGCHMPKRRTDDVVHVLMTDHLIQRNKAARDLLAPLQELHETEQTSYKGEVVLLYPPRLAATAENELYLAVAQVAEGANLKAGIPRLQKAIQTYRPPEGEFYFFLANAYRQAGQNEKAIPHYQEALRRKPALIPAWLAYAGALQAAGRGPDAARALEKAAKAAPADIGVLQSLGESYLDLGRTGEATVVLRRAADLDPELAEVYANLGDAHMRSGDAVGAVEALRTAIRLKPGSSQAHNNLANILLQESGDFTQAEYHFKRSLALDPQNSSVHYNYGRALAAKGRLEQGRAEFEAALRLDPNLAEAAASLGVLLAMKGELDLAIEQYRHAIQVKPGLTAAQFHLGLALLRRGDRQGANPHLQSVTQDDPDYFQAQFELGNILLAEGDHDAAAIHFQKAAESPQSELRAAALERLRVEQQKRQP
jgi:tetratricopeptide (TPR) repeat protein